MRRRRRRVSSAGAPGGTPGFEGASPPTSTSPSPPPVHGRLPHPAMEEQGIGRPSTYATHRVHDLDRCTGKEGKYLKITNLGRV